MVFPGISISQIQVGNNIHGESSYDEFGTSIDISEDGNRIIIGSPYGSTTSGGFERGHIQVFDYINDNWQQIGDKIIGEYINQDFGFAARISGNGKRIIVGAPFDHSFDYSRTIVYEIINNNWVIVGDTIIGSCCDEQFGWAVDISSSGNRIAIGAPANHDYGEYSGSIKIYDLLNGNWTQVGNDIHGLEGGRGGASLAISGDGNTIIFGSPNYSAWAGFVQIYHFDGNDWVLLGDQTFINDNSNGLLGESVEINFDGTKIIVGASTSDEAGPLSGQAVVYKFENSQWLQVGQKINGESQYENTGKAVSISNDGNLIAVGAPTNADTDIGAGQARIYQLNEANNQWQQAGQDINGDGMLVDFGQSVSLSGNGLRIAIGAPLSDNNGTDSGTVKVFEDFSLTTNLIPPSEVSQIKIWPNPVFDRIKVSQNVSSSTVYLLNTIGQKTSIELDSNNELNLSTFNAGIYYLQIESSNGVEVKRIIKL